jgi:predicted membrane protein
MVAVTEPPTDPVLARRHRIAHLAELGQRIGYLLFGAAVVAFVVAFIVGFSPGWVTFIVTCMAVGSIVLAPAIVAGYAVKAAEREEREQGR